MGIPGRIGNVRPFAELARGTTTSVLKAHDSDSNQVVVVKLLRREWAQDEAITARFVAEASALQSVSNGNVVRILDHGDCNEGLYIITEFVEGRTLDELISDRTVPTIIGAFIVREALAGLSAVHEAGIIHRDFKAANIVVGDSGTVKLMDFGFAESPIDSPGDAYRAVAGTLGYIAPELLSGEPASVQSDIFSAGITLLEATTGVRSRDSTEPSDRARHAAQDVSNSAIGHIDSELANLIREMTKPTASPRPPEVAVVIQAIDAVIATYRPTANRNVLSRWLAGERQTLPRKLMTISDDVADDVADDVVDNTHRIDPKSDVALLPASDVEKSDFGSTSRTHGSGNDASTPARSNTTRESISSAPGASAATVERGQQLKRRAAMTAVLLMGSLLVITVARRGITNILWPDRTEAEPSANLTAAQSGQEGDNAGTLRQDGEPPDTDPSSRVGLNSPVVASDRPSENVKSSLAEVNVHDSLYAASSLSGSTGDLSNNDPQSLSTDIPDPEAAVGSTTPTASDVIESNGGSGFLMIAASPWAHVTIGGQRIGTTPLSTGIQLTEGLHSIVFSNPNFPDLHQIVEVIAGDSTNIAVSMWSTVARLSLVVSPWAEVLIDGVVRDTIPMSTPLIIRPGPVILTLRHPELGSYSETIIFEADSTYIRRYNLFGLIER